MGGTPEYVSGHSSYSGAGATVLALFFHRDRLQPPARRVDALAPQLVGALLRGWGGAEADVARALHVAARQAK